MENPKKIEKKESEEAQKAFVVKFWNLLNTKELAKECNCSENLIWMVVNGKRTDRRNIISKAYDQITAYMQ